jgi:hypothetical protein
MTEFYFDDVDSAIKIRNDRKGKLLIRVALDNDDDDFIVKKEDKPAFVKFLKEVIKELEKV